METERILYTLLEKFIKERTTLIITHRIEVPIKFDFILKMDQRYITEIKKSDFVTNQNLTFQ